jgi:hypothetical protein
LAKVGAELDEPRLAALLVAAHGRSVAASSLRNVCRAVAGVGKPASAMSGARLIAGNLIVGGAIFEEPIREIALMFRDNAIRDANIAAIQFGPDQRIEPSRASAGYAIVSEIGEVEGSVLVSGPDAVIQGLLVRSRDASATRRGAG